MNTLLDILLEQLNINILPSYTPEQKIASLTSLLKKQPCLIVIDNLETVDDYQTLLPLLRQLVNPGKCLLTSRHCLRVYSDVFCLSLKELSQSDTLALLRYEAKVRGRPSLANASEDQLKSIYEVVGGNPLALKLIVGQIGVFSLSRVLENLKQVRGRTIDEMYTYIYWQVWQALDAVSRDVLLVMPLAHGGNLDQLAAVGKVNGDVLNQALEQLVSLSLVEVGGDLDERRYYIHRLTETFLLEEVVKWQSLSQ